MSRGASRPLGSQGFCTGRGLTGCGLQPWLLRSERGLTGTPGRTPWGWVGSGDAVSPVGVARQDSCPCPTLTSHSHPHPIYAPEAPFMASAFSATGDAGTPEAMAPVIVVPPSNRSVVAGSSETTLECIANARYAAGPPPAGSGCLPQQRRTWSHSRAVGTAHYGQIAWTLPRPCSAVFILDVTFILEVGAVTVGQAEYPLRF